MNLQTLKETGQSNSRHGFTLLELLIVISILVILLVMTAGAVRYTTNADRIKGAAAKVQSVLLGARDRAIYAKEPRGVRLFLDPLHNPNAANSNSWGVSSMVYINPDITWEDGTVTLERPDLDLDAQIDNTFDFDGTGPQAFTDQEQRSLVWIVAGDTDCGWWELKRRGLLFDGVQIELPIGSEEWYPVRTHLIDLAAFPKKFLPHVDDGRNRQERLVLQVPYSSKGVLSRIVAMPSFRYRLKLPPQILPEEPVVLPDRTIIDLDRSKVPQSWSANGGQFMDVVFHPNGRLAGDGAFGLTHLYISASEDALLINSALIADGRDRNQILPDVLPATNANGLPMDYIPGDRRIVTISPQTGKITVHEVDPTDVLDVLDPMALPPAPDGIADHPYRYATNGRAAKQ
jgi:prepilin-type N-terminal cleavage/methylation domain-containing protein